MANLSDAELIGKILDSTVRGKIDWQKTAEQSQFAAAFGGKWTVLIDQGVKDPHLFWLTLQNAEGEELLSISSDARLSDLYDKARRQALKVDEAITDLLKELEGK
jgi:hypothetical protein